MSGLFSLFPRRRRIFAFFALLALVLGLAAAPCLAATDSGFTLIRNRNGVRTYEKRFPGTPVREFKSITIIDAPLEVIAAVLRDVPSYPEWLPQCVESKLLHQEGLFDLTIYQVSDLPWPLSDRDAVIHSNVDIDLSTGRAHARLQAVSDPAAPVRDNMVRVNDLSGEFLFEYMGRQSTRVMFSYRIDPAGNIPVSLANLAIRRLPSETLIRLKEMVKKPKYIQLAKNSEEKKMVESLLANKDVVEKCMRGRLLEYFQYPELVDAIVSDKEFCTKVTCEDGNLDVIRIKVGDIIRLVLQNADIGRYLNDPKLVKRLNNEPRLVDKLIRDWLLVEMLMDGSGTFTDVVKERAKHY
ncbi:MAG: START domain-containing protein [Thermodesulfobacteriota bacterium]